jgi:hypothetical protein
MKCVLVKSRHTHSDIDKLPAIFDDIQSNQIFDFDYHKKIIHQKLNKEKEVALYVTGLTPLLISVLNYCRLFEINVVLHHYDVSINKYVAQSVV